MTTLQKGVEDGVIVYGWVISAQSPSHEVRWVPLLALETPIEAGVRVFDRKSPDRVRCYNLHANVCIVYIEYSQKVLERVSSNKFPVNPGTNPEVLPRRGYKPRYHPLPDRKTIIRGDALFIFKNRSRLLKPPVNTNDSGTYPWLLRGGKIPQLVKHYDKLAKESSVDEQEMIEAAKIAAEKAAQALVSH